MKIKGLYINEKCFKFCCWVGTNKKIISIQQQKENEMRESRFEILLIALERNGEDDGRRWREKSRHSAKFIISIVIELISN